ncbi:hypothetical protein [Aureimonas mangrovi]|nr:hypothetical protein [Aureimonas mangrovi]
MNALEIVIAVLITPVSALTIAWWVLRDNRISGERARARARAHQARSGN